MQLAVTINPNQTYTKSEYSRAFGINRVRLDQMIKDGEVKTINVRGTILVLGKS